MPRIFLSNFHFEHELADSRFVPTRKLLEINARNALSWVKMAQEGDVIALPEVAAANDIAANLREVIKGVDVVSGDRLPLGPEWIATPWGWTTSMIELSKKNRWTMNAPSIDVVKRVNSRRYAFELETSTTLQPEPSLLAGSMDDVMSFLNQSAASPWLIKGEFGMSGRERIRVEGPLLNASQLGWLKREFSAGRAVVIEPMLDRLDEVSVHYDVEPDGVARRVGIVALMSDERGQFAKAIVGTDEDQRVRFAEWETVLSHTDHAARDASRIGYLGPLGIDAMRYRKLDGAMAFRPLQDINARWTMGRLALEAARN
ncbi:hypothetical protein [Lacunimicrobium album]